MPPPSAFESYVKNINLQKLLEKLEASNIDTIVKEVKHFAEMEAENRDKIVLDYFGEYGVKRITESIVSYLLSLPKLSINAKF